jgi:signal transduction histidine kinase
MGEATLGTVLVVDDTDANRYVLTHLLRRAGYRTLEAASGAHAMEQLTHGVDLVVLDVNLPDINGTQLTQRIKESPETCAIMVLNMSASFTRTRDRVTGLDHGADGYLTQPIDPPEFLATVTSLMRIRKAEEDVRRANRDLKQFAVVASHDLQEPLRMVSSYLELLERRYGSKLDAPGRQYMQSAIDASVRMATMIDDLLAMAQMDRVPLAKQTIEAQDAVRDAVENLALKIQESQAVIAVAALPIIHADRSLIAQVFQNFISNAIKFRSQRTPEIRIEVTSVHGFHRFAIIDNGIGIPPDQLEHIFGLFQRLHAISQYPGTGIGLALCRRIIERHGGATGVKSTVGQGSSFWFTLPE